MKLAHWYSHLSYQQRIWMFGTLLTMVALITFGILMDSGKKANVSVSVGVDMSIRQIAPKLGVTPKSLTRELNLPLNVSKRKPLYSLGITDEELHLVVKHLLSHRDATLKYYVYLALVLWGWIFLVKLGRPSESNVKNRKNWYPRTPYVITLILAVVIAGFVLGKSPNPMEGIVKVFKSTVGLYPDPYLKVLALVFFLFLGIIGNKLICGWACPLGALQELIYSLPIQKRIKNKKLPFVWTNTIRGFLFMVMIILLFGGIGRRKGTVIYHYVNAFNLFDLDFETVSIALTVVIALAGSFIVYRPFCQLICPFGLVSWIAERFSIYRITIDKDKCVKGSACINACPLEATKGILAGNLLPADCFSCARCLNVCPVDALQYKFAFKTAIESDAPERHSDTLQSCK